jgi:rod shape-determining protein MreC
LGEQIFKEIVIILTKRKKITKMMQKINYKIFVIILTFLLGFSCYRFFMTGLFEHILSYAAYPILRIQHVVVDPLKQWVDKKHTVRLFEERWDQKQKECEQLLAENIELKAQLAYITDIQELTVFKQRYNCEQAHVAQILARHLSERSHYIFINSGSCHGIEPDMTVIYNNCLVGKVTQVYPWYSQVTLITDRTCKVAASCAKTKAQGIAAGKNVEDNLILRYVSHLANVEPNDMVLSSGEGLVFPQGFALGKVCEVQPDGLYQRVTISPACDLRKIRYCMVLPKGFVKKEPAPLADNLPKNLIQPQKNDQIVT